MILQLIPLIALCCVLQRNRKPSHPSRHVVGAVLKLHTHMVVGGGSSGKEVFGLGAKDFSPRVFLFKVFVNHRKNDPAAGSPTATLLRLLLPLLKKYR